jgi:phosphoglycerol transferase MdoB-like AlkP superfamily enzyme
MMVASCFDRVPSQYASGETVSSYPAEALPQVLFYTRLLADLLGRPATVLYQPKSPATLVVLSLMRLVFVPVFFLYISDAATTMIPRNDSVAIVAIFLFSFSSGYFATVAYQIAPSLLPVDAREINRTWQASLINVCFSTSILIGLAASFGVTSVLS